MVRSKRVPLIRINAEYVPRHIKRGRNAYANNESKQKVTKTVSMLKTGR